VATFAVATILGLSGVLDAMLYLLTRAWIFRTKHLNQNEPQAPGPPDGVNKARGSRSTHSGISSI
jgi:hypothetical protein